MASMPPRQPSEDELEKLIQQRVNAATEPLMRILQEIRTDIKTDIKTLDGKVDRMGEMMHDRDVKIDENHTEMRCQLEELKQRIGQPGQLLPAAAVLNCSDNADILLLAETTLKEAVACSSGPLTVIATNESTADQFDGGLTESTDTTLAGLRGEEADVVGPMMNPSAPSPGSPNSLIPEVKYRDIRILKKIGSGSFSTTVYLGRHETYGDIAYKELGSAVVTPDNKVAKRVKHEIEAHVLRHRNIITTLAMVFEARDRHYGILMEYAMFGNLDEFVHKHTTVRWFVLMSFAGDIARGLTYLHSLATPAVHGDMKVQNVLVGQGFVAKIGDFGLSKWKQFTTTFSAKRGSSSATTTHFPPECFLNINAPRTTMCDVYSYAILLWEMFSGLKPFADIAGNHEAVKKAVIDGVRPEIKAVRGKQDAHIMPDGIYQQTTRCITLCWETDAKRRPQIKDVDGEFDKFLTANIDVVAQEKKQIERECDSN